MKKKIKFYYKTAAVLCAITFVILGYTNCKAKEFGDRIETPTAAPVRTEVLKTLPPIPTQTPSPTPTLEPTPEITPTPEPTIKPTPKPTKKPTPKPTVSITEAPAASVDGLVSLGRYKLTAYCPCKKCSDNWGNKTATGVRATQGRTIAVDPRVIPYGSIVVINGHEYVAEDCGGAIKGKRIDVYFESHKVASDFGVQYAEVFLKK